MGAYREYTLSTNSFKKPRVLTGKPAVATLLVRLILLEPGTDNNYPEMGIGLVSKYRFLTEELATDLIENIKSQVATYLPELQCTNVEISYSPEKAVILKITIDDVIYTFDTGDAGIPITLKTLKDS